LLIVGQTPKSGTGNEGSILFSIYQFYTNIWWFLSYILLVSHTTMVFLRVCYCVLLSIVSYDQTTVIQLFKKLDSQGPYDQLLSSQSPPPLDSILSRFRFPQSINQFNIIHWSLSSNILIALGKNTMELITVIFSSPSSYKASCLKQ
jgi:ABC-type maltose transport system permease subunit